jgi:hypothetical protein
MSSKINRRALVVAATAAVPLASVSALAKQEPSAGDAELRRLWLEYLGRTDFRFFLSRRATRSRLIQYRTGLVA